MGNSEPMDLINNIARLMQRAGIPGTEEEIEALVVSLFVRKGTTTRETLIRQLLDQSIPDASREGLVETPLRFAKAWNFWTSGYNYEPADVLKTFEDGAENYDELIIQKHIPVWSLCEHHLAPFFGVAHIGYLPNGKIVGLSKLSRLVDVFARRLQVQERLCGQIADALVEHLQPRGVGVILECRHSCMESRGIQRAGTVTVTSALRGLVKEGELRAEFMSLVKG
jgi:GTP cyclohydrolase I